MPFASPSLLTPFLTGPGPLGGGGKLVLLDVGVYFDEVDFSALCRSVEVTQDVDTIELTDFGAAAAGYRDFGISTRSVSYQLEMFADPVLQAILHMAETTRSPLRVGIIPTRRWAISDTNPIMESDCTVKSNVPLTGGVGEAAMTRVQFQSGEITFRTTV